MPAKKTAKPRPKIKPIDRPLTHKQKAFVHWYCSAAVNFNGTEAARRAGYKGGERQLATIASQNLVKLNVAKAVKEATAIALSGAEITIEKVLRDIEVARTKAIEAGDTRTALKGSELEGKYLKMFTDRIEHVQTIEEIDDDDLVGLVSEIFSQGTMDPVVIEAMKQMMEAAGVNIGQPAAGDAAQGGAVPAAAGTQKPH